MDLCRASLCGPSICGVSGGFLTRVAGPIVPALVSMGIALVKAKLAP